VPGNCLAVGRSLLGEMARYSWVCIVVEAAQEEALVMTVDSSVEGSDTLALVARDHNGRSEN
jgi:hypothetical protein